MAGNKEILWSSIQVVLIKGASFFFSIFMARLIAPEAYGLIAMISVFIAFFQLFVDSGLGNALIQKKDKEEIDYHTSFTSNLGIAVFLYLILFFIAPIISSFYNQPELTAIVRWVSLGLVLQSLYLVQRCKLTIELNFKLQAKAIVFATFLSGSIGLIFAYADYGVWALVIQSLTQNGLTAVFMAIFTKWNPKFKFSKKSFKKLFSYGSKDLLGNIFTSFFMNINNLLIGKIYSPSSLAYYNRGFNLGFMPAGMIQESIGKVSFPVLCHLQSNKGSLLHQFYRYIGLTAYITIPIMTLLAILAKPLIIVLLTEKWIDAVPFTQVMALAFITYPINVSICQIVNAVGRPGVTAKTVIVKRIIALIILIVSVFISVEAVAWGVLISNTIEFLISVYVTSRVVGISVLSQFKPIIKPTIAAIPLIAATLVCSCIIHNFYLQIVVGLLFGTTAYIIMTYLLKMEERHYLDNIIHKVKIYLC